MIRKTNFFPLIFACIVSLLSAMETQTFQTLNSDKKSNYHTIMLAIINPTSDLDLTIELAHFTQAIAMEMENVLIVTSQLVLKEFSIKYPKVYLTVFDGYDIYQDVETSSLIFISKKIKNNIHHQILTNYHLRTKAQIQQKIAATMPKVLLTKLIDIYQGDFTMPQFKPKVIKTAENMIGNFANSGIPFSIFLSGHGSSINSKICGMDAYYFKQFCMLLKKTNPQFFVFESCHAGSLRILNDCFGNEQFPFPIGCLCYSNEVSLISNWISEAILENQKSFQLLTSLSTNKISNEQLKHAFKKISHMDRFPNNIPHLRKAYSTSFELIYNDQEQQTEKSTLILQKSYYSEPRALCENYFVVPGSYNNYVIDSLTIETKQDCLNAKIACAILNKTFGEFMHTLSYRYVVHNLILHNNVEKKQHILNNVVIESKNGFINLTWSEDSKTMFYTTDPTKKQISNPIKVSESITLATSDETKDSLRELTTAQEKECYEQEIIDISRKAHGAELQHNKQSFLSSTLRSLVSSYLFSSPKIKAVSLIAIFYTTLKCIPLGLDLIMNALNKN